MNFAEESTVAPFLLRARREGLRDFGACMSPHTAFLLLQGLDSMDLPAIAAAAEQRFKIDLSDADGRDLKTINDYVRFVNRRLK